MIYTTLNTVMCIIIFNVLFISVFLLFQLNYVSRESVICATWDDHALLWVQDGCEPIAVSNNKTTCSCSHLSSFTLLLNQSVQVHMYLKYMYMYGIQCNLAISIILYMYSVCKGTYVIIHNMF